MFYIQYPDGKGGRITERAGPDKRIAEARLAQIELARARFECLGIVTVPDVSFAEFWTELAPLLQARQQPATFTTEVGRHAIIQAYFGAQPLQRITSAHIRAFLAWLRSERGCRPSTTNRYRCSLNVCFRLAIELGYARANPVVGVKSAREEQLAVPYLSELDLARLIAAVRPDFRPAFRLAAETGLRRGELTSLEWRDIDWGAETLVVRQSKVKLPRTVPLTAVALTVLTELRETRAPLALDGPNRIFPAWQGEAKNRLTRECARAAKRAGLPSLRFHDLRHAWASGLVRAGVPIPTVGKLLGHSPTSLRVTMRYACHAPDGAEFDAIRSLEAHRRRQGARDVGAPASTSSRESAYTGRASGHGIAREAAAVWRLARVA